MLVNSSNIAQNVRRTRISKQLTQKEVAKAMGVYDSQYARIEKGEAKVSIVAIAKAAKVFDVSIDAIVFGKDLSAKTSKTPQRKKSLLEKVQELEELSKIEKTMACRLLDLAVSKKQIRELTNIIKDAKLDK